MKKGILGLVLFFCALMSYGQEWKVPLGAPSPAFEVSDKAGKSITRESLKGKVVLLNFFATWCPPCRAELPELQSQIWNKWKDRSDFTVLVLAREEGWDKLDPFVEKNGYTFPVFPDLKRGVFGLFAETSIPRNVVLDKEGKIIYQSIGYEPAEFAKLVALLEQELKK